MDETMSPRDSNQEPTSRKERSAPEIKTGGPRTPIGKAVASRNSLKHGIFSKEILLAHESYNDYYSLLSGLREYFKPVGTVEDLLVEKLAVQTWRYRRLVITEAAEIGKAGEGMVAAMFDQKSVLVVLNSFPRYETTIERSFDRTLAQLERLQRMRLGQPVMPPIKIDLSS